MLRLFRSAFVFAVAITALYASFGSASAASKPCLRHFVAFKFKESASPAQVDSVVTAFRDLKKSITQIQTLEDGLNNSPEKLNKGLSHAFLVTFANEKDRDIYLTHPAHEEFKKVALPMVADVLVMDFDGKK